MNLKNIKLAQYRNINKLELSPCDGVNIIFGDNAQGKTNLIEAIWLLTGNQSFRNAKNNELIQFNESFCSIEILFEDAKRQQKAKIIFSDKKKMYLNSVELKTSNQLKGNFYCVVFSPAHLSFIKDGPKQRRAFLDSAISQIKPQYCDYCDTYQKLLDQRNALLKDKGFANKKEMLEIWDLQIAKVGTIISIYRNDYINKLNVVSKKIYGDLCLQKEKFNIKYVSSAFGQMNLPKTYDKELVDIYYQNLVKNHDSDIRQGHSTCGVHRDDIDVFINELSVKTFGSQGQQRSSVLTLKLAEAELLKMITGENPIILLDDVMSELDVKRQDYVLNHVKQLQVFITCCDVSNTQKLIDGKIFKMENGSVLEMN